MPRGGADRRRLRPAARRPRPHRRRRAPPAALPRLLRQGLRRVHPSQLDRRRRGGREGRAAEPDAARLRLHRPRQGPRRGGLPRRRLLRRRPRARRPRRRRHHRRAVLARADGAEGRHSVEHAGGARRDPLADDELPRARRLVRRQGSRRARPRLVIRCSHHRHRPLLVLRRPPLRRRRRRQQRQHQRHRPAAARRGLRRQPARAQVQDWRRRRRRRRSGDGPRQPPDVRPRLLPGGAQAQRPSPFRCRDDHRRGGAGRHRRLGGQPAGGVLPGVRAVHGEAKHGAGQDRLRGGDQEELRRREQPLMKRELIYILPGFFQGIVLFLFLLIIL